MQPDHRCQNSTSNKHYFNKQGSTMVALCDCIRAWQILYQYLPVSTENKQTNKRPCYSSFSFGYRASVPVYANVYLLGLCAGWLAIYSSSAIFIFTKAPACEAACLVCIFKAGLLWWGLKNLFISKGFRCKVYTSLLLTSAEAQVHCTCGTFFLKLGIECSVEIIF